MFIQPNGKTMEMKIRNQSLNQIDMFSSSVLTGNKLFKFLSGYCLSIYLYIAVNTDTDIDTYTT